MRFPQPNALTFRKALPADAKALTDLVFRAKAFWGYPKEWMEAWRDELTVTPDYIQANLLELAFRDQNLVGFYGLEFQQLPHLPPTSLGRARPYRHWSRSNPLRTRLPGRKNPRLPLPRPHRRQRRTLLPAHGSRPHRRRPPLRPRHTPCPLPKMSLHIVAASFTS